MSMERVLKIKVLKGDITRLNVDVIVNAANSSLMGGGGVDGAIHRAGGPAILEACKKIVAKQGGCKTGQAVITTAGELPARFVIHTVGPLWKGGNKNEDIDLTDCYKSSMQLAIDNNCKTIAFCNISTGIYGFPKDRAAEISITTVTEFLSASDKIDQVLFVCFDDENYSLLLKQLKKFLK